MVTADTEPVTVESRVDWFHKHDPKKRPLWMVVENEKSCGWVALHSFYGRPAYDNTAEISIYLKEDERGKGLGMKVLEHSINESKKLGIKTLLGFIFTHNEPSLKLFAKCGFETWGNLKNVAVLDEVERSLAILGKRLSE